MEYNNSNLDVKKFDKGNKGNKDNEVVKESTNETTNEATKKKNLVKQQAINFKQNESDQKLHKWLKENVEGNISDITKKLWWMACEQFTGSDGKLSVRSIDEKLNEFYFR